MSKRDLKLTLKKHTRETCFKLRIEWPFHGHTFCIDIHFGAAIACMEKNWNFTNSLAVAPRPPRSSPLEFLITSDCQRETRATHLVSGYSIITFSPVRCFSLKFSSYGWITFSSAFQFNLTAWRTTLRATFHLRCVLFTSLTREHEINGVTIIEFVNIHVALLKLACNKMNGNALAHVCAYVARIHAR